LFFLVGRKFFFMEGGGGLGGFLTKTVRTNGKTAVKKSSPVELERGVFDERKGRGAGLVPVRKGKEYWLKRTDCNGGCL